MLAQLHAARRDRRERESGVSLIETMVVMVVFTIILAIITTAIVKMIGDGQRESNQGDDINAARKVITMLDHQVRYANAISTPGTGTDGSFYVEWQTGNSGQQQTCTQWRYVPTGGLMQWRTWQPPLSGSGAVTPTVWATAAVGVSPIAGSPVWSIQPPAADAAYDTHYQLTVNFTATSGPSKVSDQSSVTLTAINSVRTVTAANPTAIPPSVCTEVGRP